MQFWTIFCKRWMREHCYGTSVSAHERTREVVMPSADDTCGSCDFDCTREGASDEQDSRCLQPLELTRLVTFGCSIYVPFMFRLCSLCSFMYPSYSLMLYLTPFMSHLCSIFVSFMSCLCISFVPFMFLQVANTFIWLYLNVKSMQYV